MTTHFSGNNERRAGHRPRLQQLEPGGGMRMSRLILRMAVISVFTFTLTLTAQAPRPGAKPYSPPRTPDGRPDLQGTYDLATLTPLERPAGANGNLTEDEAAKLERQVAVQNEV